MNTMNIPGFDAEASLYKTRGRYQYGAKRDYGSGKQKVISQRAVTRAGGCIASTDGGLWCCVQGTNGPICWKFPPPPIVVALQ